MLNDLAIKSSIRKDEIPFELPTNWKWYKWSDLIVDYEQGLIRSNRELNSTGVPYLKMSNLDNRGGYSLDKLECTNVSDAELKRYKLNKGDFLINVRNSKELVGKTCVIGTLPSNLVFNHMLVRIKHHAGISNIFMNALLNTPVMRKLIDRCKKGTTTVIALYQQDLYDIPIPIPDPETQDSISRLVENIDRKIEINNEINAALFSIAKTVFELWFIHFDFPNQQNKPYKSSGGKMIWNNELQMDIPDGWRHGVLADLFDFNPRNSLVRGSISSYIDMEALPTKGFMTKAVVKKQFNGGIKFQNDDLVIARITPCLENGKTALITLLDEGETGFGSTEFIVLRGRNQSLSGYAACLSRLDLFRKYAISNMIGTSGRKRVESKILEKFPLPIPEDKILSKFEELVSPYFKKATINAKQNQALSELKNWLLPMLMNGQAIISTNKIIKKSEQAVY